MRQVEEQNGETRRDMEERWGNTRSDFSWDVNSTCAPGHFVQRLSSNDACQNSVQPVYVYVHAETSRQTTEGECDPVHSGASRREPRSPCTLHPRCIICVPRRWGGLAGCFPRDSIDAPIIPRVEPVHFSNTRTWPGADLP